jgi:hypothetical protein
MDETLYEFFDSRGLAVGVVREAGVVRGVKILGLESRNGRTYLPAALAGSIQLYEGAKVNVNHPKAGPQSPRDYQDRIGVIRNVVFRDGAGLFGDFQFNPKHALAEQLAWDAEHAPENVGFSHNVQARVGRRGEATVVEAITRVQSVDLVADPATTRGLFESIGDLAHLPAELAAQFRQRWLAELSFDELRAARPDLATLLEAGCAAEIARLAAEVERLQAAEAIGQKQQLGRRLLAEHHLPNPDADSAWARAVVSAEFLEALMACPDEAAMRKLVADRAQLVRSARSGTATGKPVSRDQNLIEEGGRQDLDAASFVRAIT